MSEDNFDWNKDNKYQSDFMDINCDECEKPTGARYEYGDWNSFPKILCNSCFKKLPKDRNEGR